VGSQLKNEALSDLRITICANDAKSGGAVAKATQIAQRFCIATIDAAAAPS
jgi:hypothetical protein